MNNKLNLIPWEPTRTVIPIPELSDFITSDIRHMNVEFADYLATRMGRTITKLAVLLSKVNNTQF